MNPAFILAAIDGAITLIEKLSPLVAQLFQKGDITVEQQKVLKDRLDALSNPDLFSGPEWQVTKD